MEKKKSNKWLFHFLAHCQGETTTKRVVAPVGAHTMIKGESETWPNAIKREGKLICPWAKWSQVTLNSLASPSYPNNITEWCSRGICVLVRSFFIIIFLKVNLFKKKTHYFDNTHLFFAYKKLVNLLYVVPLGSYFKWPTWAKIKV